MGRNKFGHYTLNVNGKIGNEIAMDYGDLDAESKSFVKHIFETNVIDKTILLNIKVDGGSIIYGLPTINHIPVNKLLELSLISLDTASTGSYIRVSVDYSDGSIEGAEIITSIAQL